MVIVCLPWRNIKMRMGEMSHQTFPVADGFQRQSLVNQLANRIRLEIERQTWGSWLPSERELVAIYLVARNTLRAALCSLTKAGLIEPKHGVGYRIVRGKSLVINTAKLSVGLLLSGQPDCLEPNQLSLISELRACLMKQKLDLHIHSRRTYVRALGDYSCWVLLMSEHVLQKRFFDNDIPCVVAGTTYSDIDLPSVDIDHRCVCRHAVGMLIARGHRRLAYISLKPVCAGDIQSEFGFSEGVRLSNEKGLSIRIVHHDGTRVGLARMMKQLMSQANPPTGILVRNSYHYLTLRELFLHGGGLNKRSLDLISRDDAPFLSHLIPAPMRYVLAPAKIAQAISQEIQNMNIKRKCQVRLVPEFIPGDDMAFGLSLN